MTLVRTGYDAWVSSATPSKNNGRGPRLRVQDGPPVKRAFVFIKNPVPQGGVVLDAEFRLHGRGTSGVSATLTLEHVTSRWAERLIDYDNQPGVAGATVTVTGTQTTDGQLWVFPVAALLQTLSDTNREFNVRIVSDGVDELQFYSFDNDDHRPALYVDWAMKPDAPTELSPAGGASVTVAKPTLLFNFHDIDGKNDMSGCHVQINPTNDFTAPAFDSGLVGTTDPELDLSTTAFAGLSVGDSEWWRVKVSNAAGSSPWSDSVTFHRIARGTLTIVSPTGGVINDATQEIIWSTDVTQLAWRVTVWDEANPGVILHDTHKQAGAATSYTLPKGVVTSESTSYRIRVRVWEDNTRTATPGDTVFTEAIATFVFAEDPTPNPFTDLVIDQLPPLLPVPRLNFQRATAPDFVSIWRDGELVATDIDPADLAVSPGVYEYLDFTAEPRLTHHYKVRPKVNGKLGPNVAGTFTFEPLDVWLADVRQRLIVPLKNPGSNAGDQVQFSAPQPGSSHLVRNGKHVIRVYQTQQGLQGTGKGIIIDCHGDTADQWLENFEFMRDRPERKFRLIVGNLNLTVVLSNIVISPYAYGGPNDSLVTFAFWSQSPDWS